MERYSTWVTYSIGQLHTLLMLGVRRGGIGEAVELLNKLTDWLGHGVREGVGTNSHLV